MSIILAGIVGISLAGWGLKFGLEGGILVLVAIVAGAVLQGPYCTHQVRP